MHMKWRTARSNTSFVAEACARLRSQRFKPNPWLPGLASDLGAQRPRAPSPGST
jgi:hypothetical protein